MKTVALFDIADQSFTFYTDEEWAKQIAEWRQELIDDDPYEGDYGSLEIDEVVDAISGEEYFWDNIA
jgi:hypothetical protein